MNVDQLKVLCEKFPGACGIDSGPPYNVLSYKVGNKKFAYFKTSEPERWRFSLRVADDRFLELTDQPGIKPARYMHRFHWVTIVDIASMDEAYLRILLSWSYDKAVSSLSKKKQREIKSYIG